jgi:hypothetical protein
MKKYYCMFFAFFIFCSASYSGTGEEETIKLIDSLTQKQKFIKAKMYQNYLAKLNATDSIQKLLAKATETEMKLDLLINKDAIENEYRKNYEENGVEISKLRYIKGLQIIKLLYEKILSLDHHFASVKTFSEISKITNPNNYPEFSKVQEMLKSKKDKKTFDLSSLLSGNIVVSAIQTLQGLLSSSLNKEEKELELKKVECILDFTLRMNTDLNTIFFETSYLNSANMAMKKDMETLYKDYTKPVGYVAGLVDCRNNDDWDAVKDKLDEYLKKITTSTDNFKKHKMQIDLEFTIDRLLGFITKYNKYIDDCTQFYEKFKVILNSYENEKQCDSKLPIEYKKLKEDIDAAIQKFAVAYKPVEVNGSKMKEILYGINEYD